jgi:tRNA nucleotidyltransferase (CCA-adding enzyme)
VDDGGWNLTVSFPAALPIPQEVLGIAEKLEDAGFETWCVGGAVRDNLLGYPNKDFDLATTATPPQVRKLFRRTIPLGIEHGTVAVLDRKRVTHEVTTFRRDVKTDGRHAVVEFGVSLEEDLARRDFTINAIAYHPVKLEWRDPFGGAGDLEARMIRSVGTPEHRFREDYLRILRALRFAARYGFVIEPRTWEAAKEAVAGLQHLSAERVREEWFGGLQGAQRPTDLVRLWMEVGALEVWLPELASAELGVGSADLSVIDRIGGRHPVLITVYLSQNPVATLTRLRCSNADIERARVITRLLVTSPDPGSPADVRRWMAAAGGYIDELVAVKAAEGSGARLRIAVEHIRSTGAPLTIGDLAIDGADLIAAGLEQGPELGRVLKELLDRVLDEPGINTKETLLRQARELVKSGPAKKRPRIQDSG